MNKAVSSPWWVLIEVVLTSPSSFLCFTLDMSASRLMIASATSRWRWLLIGLLYEIEYLRELLPWAGDTFSNSMSSSSPLVAMSSLLRGP